MESEVEKQQWSDNGWWISICYGLDSCNRERRKPGWVSSQRHLSQRHEENEKENGSVWARVCLKNANKVDYRGE